MLKSLLGIAPKQESDGSFSPELGATIVNTKSDKTCCVDRRLITGASPLAANDLGKLAASTLLEQLA